MDKNRIILTMSQCLLMIVGFFVGLYAICKLYFSWRRNYWHRKGLPCFDIDEPMGKRHATYKIMDLYNLSKTRNLRHVGVYGFLGKPEYLPVDLEILKCIAQKDFWHFPNHGMYVNERDDPLNGGLFNLMDERWKSMRIKLTPTFTSGKMKMMFPLVVQVSKGLKDIIEEHATTGDAIDIKEVLARFTTDVIGVCAFGIDCNCLKNPDTDFRRFGKKALELTKRDIMNAIITMLVPHGILKALRFSVTKKEVDEFFMDLVKKMVKLREEGLRRSDFLQLLVDLKNNNDRDGGTKAAERKETDSSEFTMNDVAAQTFAFFVAGFETSSTTMTFALYELAVNQDIQDRLREEINTVLKKHDGQFTYEGMMEMTYMDKVIEETLRKHPPVPNSFRMCSKAYKVPGSNFTIEKGTHIIFPIHPIHMDPEYYPNPEQFNPENFSEDNKARRPTFTFLPFGEGPRMCIGLRFGKMQAKVGLTAILSQYKVTLDKKTLYPMEYDPKSFILSVKGGLYINVTKI